MQRSGKPSVCDRKFFLKVARKTNDVNDAALRLNLSYCVNLIEAKVLIKLF